MLNADLVLSVLCLYDDKRSTKTYYISCSVIVSFIIRMLICCLMCDKNKIVYICLLLVTANRKTY